MRDMATSMRIRIGIAFASSEVIMNLAGAGLGELAGKLIGDFAGYLGFAALFSIGAYMVYESRRDLADRAPLDLAQGWGLVLASLSVSLDSLGIGFSILYIGAPLAVSLGVIFIVSLGATALGLTLGRRLGTAIEDRAEFLAGTVLALTGIAFALLKALRVG
jgi:manganese efflux pump family protein